MRYMWPRYVPVAERREKAAREMKKLEKSGRPLQPIRIEGRTIANTFWGRAWCEHLEGYSDFENRLPRGRSYVRNGSVCHLEIESGSIKAKVSGSSLYTITIGIKPLPATAWAEIKRRCSGEIHSLLDLLGGRLSDGVMAVVTDRDRGLFPKPREISMDCSCPDWATMCKHVAAVLYGVGARLDEHPELLFVLRGVNHEELVSAKVGEAVRAAVRGGGARRLAEVDIAEVFGLEMDEERPVAKGDSAKPAADSPSKKASPATTATRAKRAPAEQKSKAAPPFPKAITGAQVRRLRNRLGLTLKDFASLLGVSIGAVSLWEKTRGALNLQDRSRRALEKTWMQSPE